MSKKLQSKSVIKGRAAEEKAAEYLLQNGWTITQKNYRSTYGEIDIIAIKAQTIAAFEIKYRKNSQNFEFAISNKQQHRIGKSFAHFLQQHTEFNSYNSSFDVILVDYLLNINHIDNAWEYSEEDCISD